MNANCWYYTRNVDFLQLSMLLYACKIECEFIECEMKWKNVCQLPENANWMTSMTLNMYRMYRISLYNLRNTYYYLFYTKAVKIEWNYSCCYCSVSLLHGVCVSQVVKTVGYRRDVIIYAVCQLLHCYWILLSDAIKYEWYYKKRPIHKVGLQYILYSIS